MPSAVTDTLLNQALSRFHQRLEQAVAREASEPLAMTMATCDLAGRPTARTVLMKRFDANGLTFFSSDQSVKGHQIAANPRGCAVFHWRTLQQQVIVEGPISHLPSQASDDYWQTRSRESQLAAWASNQSEPLTQRADLLHRVAELDKRFEAQSVPRPDYWHGFVLAPTRIEFWQAGDNRLNERDSYRETPTGWISELLNP